MRWRSGRETTTRVAGVVRDRVARWAVTGVALAGVWAGTGAPPGVMAAGASVTGAAAAEVRAAGVRAAGVRAARPSAQSAVSRGGSWAWPMAAHVLTTPYAAPASRYAAGHRGIDLAAAPGAVVTAPDDAVVRFVGVVVDRPVLTLDHGDGVLSSYEPVASDLAVGSVLGRGAVIGSVAAGGHCDGGCLHVGVRVAGDYVSPLLFFAKVPPAILLPLGPT